MHPTEIIDIAYKKFIFPFLKNEGFKRKTVNLWKDHKECIDCLNLQKSQWNSEAEAQFTINLGIYWPGVQKIMGINPYKVYPDASRCTVDVRIETLYKGDWYTIVPESDPEDIGLKAIKDIKEFAFPWFEQGHDIHTTYKYLSQENLTRKMEGVRRYIELLKE